MPKKYRLLKDLPNTKAGEVYKQTDDGSNYICRSLSNNWDTVYPREYIEHNPTWFEEIKEKERIEVRDVSKPELFVEGLKVKWDFVVSLSRQPSSASMQKIPKLIEQAINNEQPKEETNPPTFSYKDIPLSGTMVTLEECERRERDAFTWALYEMRLTMKYPTFEDYQNQK